MKIKEKQSTSSRDINYIKLHDFFKERPATMSTMFLDNSRSTKVLPGSRKNLKQRLVPAGSNISCSEKMLY